MASRPVVYSHQCANRWRVDDKTQLTETARSIATWPKIMGGPCVAEGITPLFSLFLWWETWPKSVLFGHVCLAEQHLLVPHMTATLGLGLVTRTTNDKIHHTW